MDKEGFSFVIKDGLRKAAFRWFNIELQIRMFIVITHNDGIIIVMIASMVLSNRRIKFMYSCFGAHIAFNSVDSLCISFGYGSWKNRENEKINKDNKISARITFLATFCDCNEYVVANFNGKTTAINLWNVNNVIKEGDKKLHM